MIRLTIREDRCKACGLCIGHCPKKILKLSDKMNEAGYHPVEQTHPEECIGCGICALMCPDVCFTIEKIEEVKQ